MSVSPKVLLSPDVQPKWYGGVPRCVEDSCVSYDGKRCAVFGARPDGICEPAVVAMAETLIEIQHRMAGLEK